MSALTVDDEGWLNQTSGPVQEATDAELEDRIRKQVADDVSESKKKKLVEVVMKYKTLLGVSVNKPTHTPLIILIILRMTISVL